MATVAIESTLISWDEAMSNTTSFFEEDDKCKRLKLDMTKNPSSSSISSTSNLLSSIENPEENRLSLPDSKIENSISSCTEKIKEEKLDPNKIKEEIFEDITLIKDEEQKIMDSYIMKKEESMDLMSNIDDLIIKEEPVEVRSDIRNCTNPRELNIMISKKNVYDSDDGWQSLSSSDSASNDLLDDGWEIDYEAMRRRRYQRLSMELFTFGSDLHGASELDENQDEKEIEIDHIPTSTTPVNNSGSKSYRQRMTPKTEGETPLVPRDSNLRRTISNPEQDHFDQVYFSEKRKGLKSSKKQLNSKFKSNHSPQLQHISSHLINPSLSTSSNNSISSSTSSMPKFSLTDSVGQKKIGCYSPEARKERIRRFHEKRKRRTWQKCIKYSCRKTLAAARPRVRGRFVKVDENHRITTSSLLASNSTTTTSPSSNSCKNSVSHASVATSVAAVS